MEKKDLITVSAVLKKDGAKVKNEKFILYQDVPQISLRMSKKRKQVLEIVKKKEISLTGLRKNIPTAPALIKPLEEA
jgi:primosomal protein N' (replication factor Y)